MNWQLIKKEFKIGAFNGTKQKSLIFKNGVFGVEIFGYQISKKTWEYDLHTFFFFDEKSQDFKNYKEFRFANKSTLKNVFGLLRVLNHKHFN